MPDWKTFNEAVAEVQGSKTLKIVINAKGPVHVPSPHWDPRAHRADLVNGSPAILVLDEGTGWIPARLHPPPTASSETIDDTDQFQTKTTNIMFMDVANWSKLSAAEIFGYVKKVLPKLNEFLSPHEFRNTWGDAIVATFDNAKEAAEAALKIRDFFRASYAHDGLPPEVSCRIALHQGDPMVLRNQITGMRDIFGQGVHVAARLEPKVEPGHVFCTKKFADALAENKGAAPKAIHLGTIELAKGFGPEEVAIVLHRGEPDPGLKLDGSQPSLRVPNTSAPLGSDWPIASAIRVELLPSDEAIAIVRKTYTDIRLHVRVMNLAPFPVKMHELHLRWQMKASPDGVSPSFGCDGDEKVVKATREITARSPYEFPVSIKAELPEVAPAPVLVRFGTGGHIVAHAEPWGGNQEHQIGDFVWGYLIDSRPDHE